MYSRGKAGQPVPSDAQAKEKYDVEKNGFRLEYTFAENLSNEVYCRLIVFVYEYLHHMGASQAAGMFLQEVLASKHRSFRCLNTYNMEV